MVALIPAAILLLTAGLMVHYTSLAWRRSTDAVELQRDATVAAHMLYKAVREAMAGDLTSPTEGLSSAMLAVPPRAFYRAAPDLSFDASGSTLVYDPDTSAGSPGDEIIIVKGRVDTFTCSHVTNGLQILLGLAERDEFLEVDTVIYFRNEPN